MDQSLRALFLREYVWTHDPESSSKVFPETGIGPWMVLPTLGAKIGTAIFPETVQKHIGPIGMQLFGYN